MKIIFIEATSIPDAWFQCLYRIMDEGWVYTIQRGSFEGQKRLEFEFVIVHIKKPGVRPLIPDMPPGSGLPSPTDMEYVDKYLEKLMTSLREPNEDYTYGEDLEPQIYKVIDMYKKQGHNTNQGYMAIGSKSSIDLNDPPCLRGIDTRIKNGKLHFIVYFRSNDLWAGFPSNLPGIQLLKEFMASEIGVEDGEIIYQSKGLHLYDYTWELAATRTGKPAPKG